MTNEVNDMINLTWTGGYLLFHFSSELGTRLTVPWEASHFQTEQKTDGLRKDVGSEDRDPESGG